MFKRVLSLLGAAVFGGLVVFLLTNQTESPVVQNTAIEDPAIERADVTTQEPGANGLDQPAAPASARPAEVRQLADGDSFDIVWLDTDERDEVRMFGINAPEGDACFGNSSRDILRSLTDDQELLVEPIERDEFGRILGNVWVDGLFINATMVEVGAALALSDGGRFAGLITEAQDAARSNGAGLWNPDECGADPTLDVFISEIFANAPGPDNENKNGEYIVIENAGSLGADMTGWSIRDESTRHRFSFPDGHTIAAGDVTTVFSGCGNDTDHELFWCDDDPVWNNGGDTGFLVDPDGRFADSLSYSG